MRGVADEIEPWLLRCDAVEMTLSRLEGEEFRVIESCPLSEPVDAVSHRSSEYDDVLTGWIRSFAFELVHVRHFAWHSLGLFSVCTVLRVPVIFSFHDFYALCPTVNLLDAELEYCAGSCTRSRVECQVDLWPEGALPPLKHNWINRWQSLMRESLKLCAAFVTTSEHVRQTVLARYPELGEVEFSIIPHGRQFVRMRDHSELPPQDGVVKILVPGNINPKKGSEFVRQLHDCDEQRRLEFHLLGNAVAELQGERIVRHGEYVRDDFANRVAEIRPHFGCIFSLCPESYCHTLTELWSVGVPVLGFDIGAVGERIRDTGAGWFVSKDDLQETINEIYRLAASRADYDRVKTAVDRWQTGLGARQTIDFMSSHYKDLYARVLVNRRAFQSTGTL